jgi:predicted alpha-1,6-mannanase (GH76 family)
LTVWICAIVCGSIWGPGLAGAQTARTNDTLAQATRGIEALQRWYDPSTGLYKGTGWWNSANALTTLADYARIGGSHAYDGTLANSFEQAQKTNAGFLNEFYDDEGWWALAWIDAYDLTGERRYRTAAEAIFLNMAGGWDQTCGGGIWWSKERKYKNAIANELFLSVAAHLANRDKMRKSEFLGWANREWQWFQHSGMINRQGRINDGLKIEQNEKGVQVCRNNGSTEWSYNQGVVLGGLVELARADHDRSLPVEAGRVATAAITKLTDSQGILHDECEPQCNADAVQFKGIFVRNLAALNHAYPRTEYATFLRTNAESVWQRAQGSQTQFGVVWSGPFDTADAGTQSSAVDALVAGAVASRQ